MLTENEGVVEYQDWTLRIRRPEGPGPHQVLLLLHGWTGDENVMWIFTPRLPKSSLLIAPRGLKPAPQGGYSWNTIHRGGWASVSDFRPAVDALLDLIVDLKDGQAASLLDGMEADFSKTSLLGFSQGAALTYIFSLLHPERVQRLAGLAGFIPEGAQELIQSTPLKGKRAFVAHGRQDETVPIEKARQAVELLEQAGAQVTYCEDDVGHKLSASCFRGLGEFFKT